MTSHRLSLTLILVAAAVAGMIVGYALAGLDDGVSLQAQAPDTMPLPQLTATERVPTPTPTPIGFIVDLPLCVVALPGSLCTQDPATFFPCPTERTEHFGALPCLKS